jgi:hypothetical protein
MTSSEPFAAGTGKLLLEGVLTAHHSRRRIDLAGVSVEYYAQLERGNLSGDDRSENFGPGDDFAALRQSSF